MTVLVVTGTGTGVGKTIATAALASAALAAGVDVAVCKPVQTGTDPADGQGDDDLVEVTRLAGTTTTARVSAYREPLAPAAAAALEGRPLPSPDDILTAIRSLERPGRLTLVEGAGGLLVELAADGATLRDCAADLAAPVLIVCAAGLGTLNHTALTLEALTVRGLGCAGLVIGAWPAQPGAAEVYNRDALAAMAPVRAVLPEGAGALDPTQFAAMSRAAFDPDWVCGLA